MNRLLKVCLMAHVATASAVWGAALEADEPVNQPSVQLENLLRTELEVADGLEVMVSRVSVPPHSALPKHWHPGEEFGYVIEGKVSLWLEGKVVGTSVAGDAVKIPRRKVHTALTGDEGAELLVFRVHPVGEPERVLVE